MVGTSLDRYTLDDGRIYTDHDELWLPSVSTVLDVREMPPALRNYLKNTSQAKQDQKTFYTQNRGTLLHWHLLSELDPDLEWTDDEQHSKECLKGTRTHEETGLTGGYETWERFCEDKEWALDAWSTMRRIFDIHPENTLGVELFVKNTDVQYAGQFDLLSADPDTGEVVLRDIKTGKRVYDKNLLQLEAYAHAVDIAVDRLEVIRVHPDGETWEVSSSNDWIEDRSDLWAEFVDLRDTLEEQRLDDLKGRIQSE